MEKNRKPPKHGKRGTYVNHGCRCELCCKANRDYQRPYMRSAYKRWAKAAKAQATQ